jgi:hypothetical protein
VPSDRSELSWAQARAICTVAVAADEQRWLALVCTDAIDLVVPMRGSVGAYKATTLKLQATARTYEDVLDKDKLMLRCLP